VTGWAYATLQGKVGLPVVDPAPWDLDSLAQLATLVGTVSLADAARCAMDQDRSGCGGLSDFVKHVGRWLTRDQVARGCQHGQTAVGARCPACRRKKTAPAVSQGGSLTSEGQQPRDVEVVGAGQPGDVWDALAPRDGETYADAIRRASRSAA
jgi:hypothetical protein